MITSLIKRPNTTGDISVNNSILQPSSSMITNLNVASFGTFLVGMMNNAGNHYYDGLIAELIIFERALSDAERLEVTKYLSKKWGIKIS